MDNFLAELIGTMLLVLLGDGVVGGVVLKGTKSENAGWIVVTLGWGLAVALSVYAVGSYSGAHINPAVTLALACTGDFAWANVPSYILAQMLGGLIGATLVWIHYLPHWGQTGDQASKLGVFCTAPAIRSTWSNLVSEMIGTFVLILGLLFIGAGKFSDGLNPIIIGGLIIAIGVSLGGTTGYAINPARDLAPRIAHFILPIKGKGSSDWGYSWIPVVGPILGGCYGACFYQAVFQGNTSTYFWICTAVVIGIIAMAVVKENK